MECHCPKETEEQLLVKTGGKVKALTCCCWQCIIVQPSCKPSRRFLLKTTNTLAVWSSSLIYCKYTQKTWRDMCSTMLTAEILKIAKIWNQLRYPLSGKWQKTMWYTSIMRYYSAVNRKKWYSITYIKMIAPGGNHTEWNKPDTERQIPLSYMFSCKGD